MFLILGGILLLVSYTVVSSIRSGKAYKTAVEASEWAFRGPSASSKPEHFAFEVRLSMVADHLANDIEMSRAWRSDWLDTHRVRMNPRQEAAQVIAGARELCEVRRDLGAAPDRGAAGGQPLAAYEQHQGDLAAVEQTLVGRVAALKCYLDGLDRFALLLAARDSLERSGSVSGRVAELVGRSVQDEMATESLNRLDDEMQDIAEGLRVTLSILA